VRQLDDVTGRQVEVRQHLALGVAGDQQTVSAELDDDDEGSIVLALVPGRAGGRPRRQDQEAPPVAGERDRGGAPRDLSAVRGQLAGEPVQR